MKTTNVYQKTRLSLYNWMAFEWPKWLFVVVSVLMTSSVLANPVLSNVAAGRVTIQQTANSTVIDQSSQKAIINWQSFNIGSQQSTHFQQPAGGIALNRISPTQGASQIYGILTATGQIILINPAGIFFGPSAYVNVGGMIATTANITNQDFLQANYQFSNLSGYNGAVINTGTIIAANHGLVALVGSGIENNGLIEADLGHIILASGGAFTINFAGDDLINFAITTPTSQAAVDPNGNTLKDGVSNTGSLIADGGQILVTADAAQGILDNSIDMQGIAQARSVGTQDGEIILSDSTNGGVVNVTGTLDASGKQAGQTGGTVEITGYNILLNSSSNIDVSGNAGGGNIYVGGNAHGVGPLPNANAVVMAPGATLNASAINDGNGGNVVLWSNEYTEFDGNIFAEGGASGGNGGQVETSSQLYLDAFGNVNASAPNGLSGMWLMDPYNITITADTTSNGGFNGLSPNMFAPTGNAADAGADMIDASLNNGTSVIIATGLTGSAGSQAGTINVSSPISTTYSGLSIPTLTLNAESTITIGAAIGFTGSGLNVTLSSGAAIKESAAGDTIMATALSTNSVTGLTFSQSNAVSNFSATNTTSGNIAFTNADPLTITGITQSGGNLTIDNTGAISQSGAISVSGTTNISIDSNPITLTNAGNSFTGAVSLSNSGANDVALTNSGALTLGTINVGSGLLTIDSTAGGLTSGAITDTADAITQASGAGAASFTAGAGAITLTDASNSFTGAVSLSNSGDNNISLTNNGALMLGTLNVGSGTLTVSSAPHGATSGSISQSGPIIQAADAGAASFTAGANAITLTNTGNSFTGAVSLSNSGANNVALTNDGVLTLGTVSVGSGLLTVDSTAGGLTSGAITDTADAITQAAGAGIVSFTAGAAAITLTNASNSFTGQVNLANSGVANDVALTNSAALTLGPLVIGGNLTVNGGLAVTAAAAISAGGTVAINANTSGANPATDNFTMNTGSSIATLGNAVMIVVNTSSAGKGTAVLGNIQTAAGGTITVSTTGSTLPTSVNTTGGSITQAADTALNAGTGGTVNLFVPTASKSAIGTLTANILTTTAGGTLNLELGSDGAFVTNTGDLTLGAPTVTSANYPLSIISSNTLTLPAFDFSTGTGALTLESLGGSLSTNGMLSTGTSALTLIGSTGLTIGDALTTTTGAIDLSTTTSGDVIVNSAGSINSTSGALTLSAMNNVNLAGAINEGSGTISISANQGGGSGNFILNAGSGGITTTNTTTSAIGITVNTVSGGTGSAFLGDNILSGNNGVNNTIAISTTGVLAATGGNSTGGSITQSAGTIGNNTSGKVNISLFVPTSGSSGISGISGTDGNAISTTTTGDTLTLMAGSSGAFDLTTGSATLAIAALNTNSPLTVVATGALTLPDSIISTGTGNLDLESDGGTLSTSANLSTTTGNLTLVSATGLTINNTLMTGSGNILLNNTTSGNLDLEAGSAINSTSGSLTLDGAQDVIMSANSSGVATINLGSISSTTGLLTINANTSGGTSANNFTMSQSGSNVASITTANASANAIAITVNAGSNGTSSATLGDITMTGNGTLAVNANGGSITQLSNGNLSIGTGAGGIVNLTTSQSSSQAIGTAGSPLSVIEANVINAISGSGGISLTNTANTNGITLGSINTTGALNVTTTGPIAQQTAYSNNNAITISGTGTSTFNAGAYSITLGNPNNQLNANANANGNPFPAGPFVHDGGTASNNAIVVDNSGPNDVTVVTQGILVMGTSSVGSGLLSLSGTNGVGEVYGEGRSITTAANAAGIILNGGTGPVVFENDVGNNFNGPVAIVTTNTTSGTVAPNPGTTLNIINNLNPLVLGTVNGTATNVGGSLLVSAQGSLTENAALTVGGTMTVGATAPNTDILLNSFDNDFGTNPVTFGPFSPTNGVNLADIRDVMIEATNSAAAPTSYAGLTNLRNVMLDFTSGATLSLPAMALSGTLTLEGPMAVTQQAGTTISAGALTGNIASSINLGNSGNAIASLGAITVGSTLTINDNVGIVLNNIINANAAGDAIVLAGPTFTNNVGASALNPGIGSFLVWSDSPSNDTINGLAYNFEQYSAIFGSTTVLGTGNGFLYSVTPIIKPLLVGTVSKAYDGTTTATLTSGNYAYSGALGGDIVTLNDPVFGNYNTPGVGTSKNVSVSGIAITSITNGNLTIYGYQLGSTTANANIGIITGTTPAPSVPSVDVSAVMQQPQANALSGRTGVVSSLLNSNLIELPQSNEPYNLPGTASCDTTAVKAQLININNQACFVYQ